MEFFRRNADALAYPENGGPGAVVSNGLADFVLGDIGALASKPVMEGKEVLFKKFAEFDMFDIEVDESDPDALADTIRRLKPTFGVINLEDINAPIALLRQPRPFEKGRLHVLSVVCRATMTPSGAGVTSALKGRRYHRKLCPAYTG